MRAFRLGAWLLGLVLVLLMGFFFFFSKPELERVRSVESRAMDRLVEASSRMVRLELEDTYDGPAIATLIHSPAPIDSFPRGAILYIHGFGDYFFQHHVKRWAEEAGFAFFALELRRYGRSWLPHQQPNYVRELDEYFEEIDSALGYVERAGYRDIVLMGHSTGGLTASVYARAGGRRDALDGLILNSPFLDFKADVGTEAAIATLGTLSALKPQAAMPGRDTSRYTQSLHAEYAGRWDFNTVWKPIRSFPIFLAWLGAVRRGHSRIAEGLDLGLPILMLHSDSSYYEARPPEAMQHGDAVLDVEDMRRLAPRLGAAVERVEIPDALHDVFLSRPQALDSAFRATEVWLDRHFPVRGAIGQRPSAPLGVEASAF